MAADPDKFVEALMAEARAGNLAPPFRRALEAAEEPPKRTPRPRRPRTTKLTSK